MSARGNDPPRTDAATPREGDDAARREGLTARALVAEFAAVFDARLRYCDGAPVLVFERGLTDASFRGLQRALRGRYLRAWLAG